MGIIIRQSLKSAIASYSGVLLGALNIMVLFPKYFEDSQFGLTRVLLAVSTIVAQFAEFGGSNVINRFFPFFRDDRNTLKRFIFWILVVAVSFCAVILFVIYVFRAPILAHYEERGSPLIVDFFGYVFPLTVFILIFGLLESYSRSLLRVALPVFLRDTYVRLFQLAAILLYIFKWVDFNEFMALFAASYGTAMLIILGYVFWLDRHFITPSLSFRKHEMLREITIYGLYSTMTSGVWRTIFQLDIIMLSYLGSADALGGVAVYSIAAYIVILIQLPQRALTQIATPIISSAIKHEQWETVKELYQRVGLNQLVVGIFLALGIWVNLHNLYHFLPKTFHHMDGIVLALLIGKLFDMMTSFNGEIIAYSKHFRFNFWTGILLVALGIVTNLILIPVYGILGAAIATSFTLVVVNMLRIIFIYRKKKVHPFSKEMIIAFPVGLAVLGLYYLTPDLDNVYLNFIARSALVVLVFVPLVFFLKVSKDLNDTGVKIFDRAKSIIGL